MLRNRQAVHAQGWPEPYMSTVFDRRYGSFPAINTAYTPYIRMNVWFWPKLCMLVRWVGHNSTQASTCTQGWPQPYMYGVYTVFLAGKSPSIRSYTMHTHGSGQPYIYMLYLCLTHFFVRDIKCAHSTVHKKIGRSPIGKSPYSVYKTWSPSSVYKTQTPSPVYKMQSPSSVYRTWSPSSVYKTQSPSFVAFLFPSVQLSVS